MKRVVYCAISMFVIFVLLTPAVWSETKKEPSKAFVQGFQKGQTTSDIDITSGKSSASAAAQQSLNEQKLEADLLEKAVVPQDLGAGVLVFPCGADLRGAEKLKASLWVWNRNHPDRPIVYFSYMKPDLWYALTLNLDDIAVRVWKMDPGPTKRSYDWTAKGHPKSNPTDLAHPNGQK